MPEALPAHEALKAFVISPIGEPGSPERIHADWVLESVIRPACAVAVPGGLSLHATRAEHNKRPADIMEEVINAITLDRVIFAVRAFNRPNVYYEIGLAMAAGRKVIVLREDKEANHFDLMGYRAIRYSYGMEGKPLEDKIQEVADFVRSVLDDEPYEPTVFKQNLNPMGRLNREYEFKKQFRDIDIPSYFDVFSEASIHIGLQGVSLLHFARQDFLWNVKVRHPATGALADASLTFFDIIRIKILFDAVDVRIVMMHDENPALPHLLKFVDRNSFPKALATSQDEIRKSFDAWSALKFELDAKAAERADQRKGKLEITQLVNGVVNYRLTMTDKVIVVSPYFNHLPFNGQGPALIVRKDTPFYDGIHREFIERIEANDRAAAALKEHGSLEVTPPVRAAE